MPGYLLAYHGGHAGDSLEGRKRVMAGFGRWFAGLGPRLVDPGNPVSRAVTAGAGSVGEGGGANPVSGYTVIEAGGMQTVIELVRRGPVVQGGRTVEIVETVPAL